MGQIGFSWRKKVKEKFMKNTSPLPLPPWKDTDPFLARLSPQVNFFLLAPLIHPEQDGEGRNDEIALPGMAKVHPLSIGSGHITYIERTQDGRDVEDVLRRSYIHLCFKLICVSIGKEKESV